jgi:cytoskeletal protein CcmA (bactofilin family)
MNCPSEITCSIYADGETPPLELKAVEEHLAACPQCRARVDALRRENLLLSSILKEENEPALEASPSSTRLGLGLVMLLAAAVAIVSSLRWLLSLIPGFASWINPLNRDTLMNLMIGSVLYLAEEGGAMFHTISTTLEYLVLAAVLLAGIYFVVRRLGMHVALLAGAMLALLLGVARPAQAITHRGGERVLVAQGETLDDSLLAGAGIVEIDGTVNGNLIASGQRVTIKGRVKGDVFAWCQELQIEGVVEGNVYVWSQFASFSGEVQHSLMIFTQALRMQSEANIHGDLIAYAGRVNMAGKVGHELRVNTGWLELSGQVGHNVVAHAGHLTVLPSTRVGENLIAYVHNSSNMDVQSGAVISGKTETRLPPSRANRFAQLGFYVWQLIHLAAAFLTGLVLFRLAPWLFRSQLVSTRDWLRALGIGFLALLATPAAAALAAITMVGMPLGIMTLALWLASLYIAKIFVAEAVAETFMHPASGSLLSWARVLLSGLVILMVATNLPYVGSVVSWAVVVLGLGRLASALIRHFRTTPVPALQPAV